MENFSFLRSVTLTLTLLLTVFVSACGMKTPLVLDDDADKSPVKIVQ